MSYMERLSASLMAFLFACSIPIAALADSGMAPEGTVTISKEIDLDARGDDDYLIKITSRVDSVQILNVVVNRGACVAIARSPGYPLRFGQTFVENALCNPLEVKVTTSLGTATAEWDD